jgi:chromosome segregation ATPase
MADDPKPMRQTLDELEAQLAEIRGKDPQLAAHLDEAVAAAERALKSQSPRAESHRSLIGRLTEAVEKYEASHPSLAANLGSLIDALSQIGI